MEQNMDWDRVKINWNAHSASAKQQWPLLSDEDLSVIGGDREKLMVYLQDANGYGKARAEFDVEAWKQGLNDSATLVAANNDEQPSTMTGDAERRLKSDQPLDF
jgi:uncharacterized protein YjbJ (UPF0337 family)